MTQQSRPIPQGRSEAAKTEGRHSYALEELVELLSRVHFSAHYSPYAGGKHVAVLIAPRWNEDGETIRVTIQCLSRGHWEVPWEGMPLFIYPSDASPDQARQLAFLNTRGSATLFKLQPGEYRVMCSTTYGVSRRPIAVQRVQPPWDRRFDSVDKRVSTVVHQKAGGLYEVSAESSRSEKALENAVVLYAFVEQESNTIRRVGRAVLQPRKDVLLADWHQPAHCAAADPYETRYAFCVVPHSSGSAPAADAIPELLLRSLEDMAPGMRAAAAEAIGTLGAAAGTEAFLERYAPLLEVEAAAQPIGPLAPARAMEVLLEHLMRGLEHELASVRAAAAEAIAALGPAARTEAVLERLARLLEDEDPDVRAAAARALGAL